MMPREPDLFDWKPPAGYPEAPGYKEHTTSKAAARKISGRAPSLRDEVLQTLKLAWPRGMTADEVADKLGRTEFSIRPRFSELRALKEIMPTDIRRPNKSGVDAIVWVSKNPVSTDGA